MDQREFIINFSRFSALQIAVYNACMEAAAKKARFYIGLSADEKQDVIDEIEKLKVIQTAQSKVLQDWERFKSEVNIVNNETVTKYYIPESHFDDSIIQKIIPDFRGVVVENIYRDEVYGSTGQLIRDKLIIGRSVVLYKQN